MVVRMVRTGTGRRSSATGNDEVTAASCPRCAARNPVASKPQSAVVRRADGARLGQARTMSTPETENPQPRDIALEQETPEQAAELEAQSDPDPGADES